MLPLKSASQGLLEVPAKSGTLRSAFCTRYRCGESSFEREFFRRTVYRHAALLAAIIRWWSPRFFRTDRDFIQWVGAAASLADVQREINDFEYVNHVSPHWLRTGLLVRLSPSRVRSLARACFAA